MYSFWPEKNNQQKLNITQTVRLIQNLYWINCFTMTMFPQLSERYHTRGPFVGQGSSFLLNLFYPLNSQNNFVCYLQYKYLYRKTASNQRCLFPVLEMKNHFDLSASKGQPGWGNRIQILHVRLYNLVAEHIAYYIFSRTCYIAWLYKMLFNTVDILYTTVIIEQT